MFGLHTHLCTCQLCYRISDIHIAVTGGVQDDRLWTNSEGGHVATYSSGASRASRTETSPLSAFAGAAPFYPRSTDVSPALNSPLSSLCPRDDIGASGLAALMSSSGPCLSNWSCFRQTGVWTRLLPLHHRLTSCLLIRFDAARPVMQGQSS